MADKISDKVSKMAQKLKSLPVVSGLSAIFGAVAGVGFWGGVAVPGVLPAMMASPVVSAGLMVPAALNLLDKDRSNLSKIFSAAAIASAGTGLAMMASVTGSAALGAPLFTLAGMTAAGVFNVASDFIKDRHMRIAVSVEKKTPASSSSSPPSEPPAP